MSKKMPQAARLSITELAGRHGLTLRALRYYEEIGIISPKRVGDAKKIREYDRADVARIKLTLQAKTLGLSLDEIASMLGPLERPVCTIGDLLARFDPERLHKILVDLVVQRKDIDDGIADVRAALLAQRKAEAPPVANGVIPRTRTSGS